LPTSYVSGHRGIAITASNGISRRAVLPHIKADSRVRETIEIVAADGRHQNRSLNLLRAEFVPLEMDTVVGSGSQRCPSLASNAVSPKHTVFPAFVVAKNINLQTVSRRTNLVHGAAKVNQRLHDVFIEDFRLERNEIQGPVARKIFVVAKASHLAHLLVASYITLIAAADTLGHPGMGMLLESCLADKLAFMERTRRLIRAQIAEKVTHA
jgi:hypothetical protein